MSTESYCRYRLGEAVRLAREASRESWKQPARFKPEYLWIKNNYVAQARYWRRQI